MFAARSTLQARLKRKLSIVSDDDAPLRKGGNVNIKRKSIVISDEEEEPKAKKGKGKAIG